MLIVIALCACLQSGVALSVTPRRSRVQNEQTWREYFTTKAKQGLALMGVGAGVAQTYAPEQFRSGAEQAARYVGASPFLVEDVGEIATGAGVSIRGATALGGMMGAAHGGRLLAQSVEEGDVEGAVLGSAFMTAGIGATFSSLGIFNNSDLLSAISILGITSIAAGLVGVFVYSVRHSLNHGYLMENGAVSAIKEVIRAVINDKIAYPTINIKLEALAYFNEFFSLPQQDGNKIAFDTADPIVQKARDELYKEIENESKSRSQVQLEKEEGIDRARIALKNSLLKSHRFSTTTEQKIIMLVNDDFDFPDLTDLSGISVRFICKAYASEVIRLKNKLAVEQQQQQQQTPSQREAQQVWKQLSQEEAQEIARRKEEEVSSAEWLKQLEKKRQQEQQQQQQQQGQ